MLPSSVLSARYGAAVIGDGDWRRRAAGPIPHPSDGTMACGSADERAAVLRFSAGGVLEGKVGEVG